MSFSLSEKELLWLREHEEETLSLIEALCAIPAPSGHEEKRAEFCKKWLDACGCRGVYVDSDYNTVYPIGCDGCDDITLFIAHTDTVFPDTEPMPYSRDEEYLRAPGVGDDTASVAVLLTVAKYIASCELSPRRGIIIAANSGEEGLGNLRGIRRLMKDYEGRISAVYSLDANYDSIVNKCVGSHRYRVSLFTEGGHSFASFGKRNAIHAAAELVCKLYSCSPPSKEGTVTTYNVGIIEGGTSVNTIAQSASFLYEYRSDCAECLDMMKKFFYNTISEFSVDRELRIEVECVGERPCAGAVDKRALRGMTELVGQVCRKYSGMECVQKSGSTDANIPMAQGVPALTFGVYLGDGSHTREERVLVKSIPTGLKIAAEIILAHLK